MDTLNELYNGKTKKSVYFRLGLVAFDVITISFFIVTSMVEISPWILAIDFIIAFFFESGFYLKIVDCKKSAQLFHSTDYHLRFDCDPCASGSDRH